MMPHNVTDDPGIGITLSPCPKLFKASEEIIPPYLGRRFNAMR